MAFDAGVARSLTLFPVVLAVVLAAVAAPGAPAGAVPVGGPPSPRQADGTVGLRLIGINDFHGHLQPSAGSDGTVVLRNGARVRAGGGAWLAAHVRRLRHGAPASMVVGTGDLIGASPLVSSLFHDEPTVDLMNRVGMVASAAGNHEFEEGYRELERIQWGGCDPHTGCTFGTSYGGARFSYLGANVTRKRDGADALPPYAIRRVRGIPVGFIGVSPRDTRRLVPPGATEGLRFGDEVRAADHWAGVLDRMGVKTIILLLHQGDVVRRGVTGTPRNGPDGCALAPGGRGGEIARRVSPKIDAVLSGHTHQQYVCSVRDPAGRPRPFVQGLSYGRELSVVDLRLDPRTKDVVRARTRAFNEVVTHDLTPDRAAAALVERAVRLAAPTAGGPAGRVSASVGDDETGESPQGRRGGRRRARRRGHRRVAGCPGGPGPRSKPAWSAGRDGRPRRRPGGAALRRRNGSPRPRAVSHALRASSQTVRAHPSAGRRGALTDCPFRRTPPARLREPGGWPGPDVVLRDDDGMCLLVRDRAEEALDAARDRLPGGRLNG